VVREVFQRVLPRMAEEGPRKKKKGLEGTIFFGSKNKRTRKKIPPRKSEAYLLRINGGSGTPDEKGMESPSRCQPKKKKKGGRLKNLDGNLE